MAKQPSAHYAAWLFRVTVPLLAEFRHCIFNALFGDPFRLAAYPDHNDSIGGLSHQPAKTDLACIQPGEPFDK